MSLPRPGLRRCQYLGVGASAGRRAVVRPWVRRGRGRRGRPGSRARGVAPAAAGPAGCVGASGRPGDRRRERVDVADRLWTRPAVTPSRSTPVRPKQAEQARRSRRCHHGGGSGVRTGGADGVGRAPSTPVGPVARRNRTSSACLRFRLPRPRRSPRRSVTAVTSSRRWSASCSSASARIPILYDIQRRRGEMSLAAEMQWQQLPPLQSSTPAVRRGRFPRAGLLGGGDGFDYSINGDELDITIYDAVGHGLRSALLSALTIASASDMRVVAASDCPSVSAPPITALESVFSWRLRDGTTRGRLSDDR